MPTATNPITGQRLVLSGGKWLAYNEDEFKNWYAGTSQRMGLSHDPDDPEHHYDYRAAFVSGAMPGEDNHWPSEFKGPKHPNRYVDGIDTITGQPAKTATNPETGEKLVLHEGLNQWMPINKAAPKPEEAPEPGVFGSAGRGFAAGVLGIPESVGTGIQYLGERLKGQAIPPETDPKKSYASMSDNLRGKVLMRMDELRKQNVDKTEAFNQAVSETISADSASRQKIGGTVSEFGKTASDYYAKKGERFEPPASIKGKNVWDNPGLLKSPTWWAYNTSQMLPSLMATYIPGLGTASVLTKLNVTANAAKIGAALVGGMAGGALEGSSTYKDVLKNGGTEEEAARAAELMALASAGLNALSTRKLLDKAGQGFLGKLKKAGINFVTEGSTEGAEEPADVASRLAAKLITGQSLPENIGGLFVESLKEAATVFPIAGVTGAGASVMGRSEKAQKAPEAADKTQWIDTRDQRYLDQMRADLRSGKLSLEEAIARRSREPAHLGVDIDKILTEEANVSEENLFPGQTPEEQKEIEADIKRQREKKAAPDKAMEAAKKRQSEIDRISREEIESEEVERQDALKGYGLSRSGDVPGQGVDIGQQNRELLRRGIMPEQEKGAVKGLEPVPSKAIRLPMEGRLIGVVERPSPPKALPPGESRPVAALPWQDFEVVGDRPRGMELVPSKAIRMPAPLPEITIDGKEYRKTGEAKVSGETVGRWETKGKEGWTAIKNVERLKKLDEEKAVQWEAEGEVKPKVHDYSSTQINLPELEAESIRRFAAKIPEKEIYTAPDDNYGREAEPHVTVRYGMETLDPGEIAPAFEGMGPIKAKMGKVSIFESDKYDVVKVDIESDDLRSANKRVGETVDLPGETFKDYKPHATIAYVKKGEGKKYVGNAAFEGKEITIDEIVLSAKDGKMHKIKLSPKPEAEPEAKSEIIKVRDVYGQSRYVNKADLDSGKDRLSVYNPDGSKKDGRMLLRDNIDIDGSKQKARNAEAGTPDLVFREDEKGNYSFGSRAAAQRELNRRGLEETHEVVNAKDEGFQAGFIGKRKGEKPEAKKEAPKEEAKAPAEVEETGEIIAIETMRDGNKYEYRVGRIPPEERRASPQLTHRIEMRTVGGSGKWETAGHGSQLNEARAIERFAERIAEAEATRDFEFKNQTLKEKAEAERARIEEKEKAEEKIASDLAEKREKEQAELYANEEQIKATMEGISFKRKMISIAQKNAEGNKKREDVSAFVIGDYGYRKEEKTYTITHIPSGMAAVSDLELKEARELTYRLSLSSGKWDGKGKLSEEFKEAGARVLRQFRERKPIQEAPPKKEEKAPEKAESPDGAETLIPFSPSDLSLQAAQAAHRGTSWTPDERGKQEQQGYFDAIKSVHDDIAKDITPEQRERAAEELTRFKESYLRKYMEVLSSRSRVMSTMIAGGSNFPSRSNQKKGDTADKKMKEFFEWRDRAVKAIRKNLGLDGGSAISSDDADAVEKIDDKIQKLEERQELMKKVNAAYRNFLKKPESLETADIPDQYKNVIRKFEPDPLVEKPFPSFELTNNAANIRRLKERSGQIEKARGDETAEFEANGITVTDSVEDNRVQITFPGKPDAETIKRLKGGAFKWAPSLGVWQRMRSPAALQIAKDIAGVESSPLYSTLSPDVRRGVDSKTGQGIPTPKTPESPRSGAAIPKSFLEHGDINKDGDLTIYHASREAWEGPFDFGKVGQRGATQGWGAYLATNVKDAKKFGKNIKKITLSPEDQGKFLDGSASLENQTPYVREALKDITASIKSPKDDDVIQNAAGWVKKNEQMYLGDPVFKQIADLRWKPKALVEYLQTVEPPSRRESITREIVGQVNMTGDQLYSFLVNEKWGNERKASQALRDRGIPGIITGRSDLHTVTGSPTVVLWDEDYLSFNPSPPAKSAGQYSTAPRSFSTLSPIDIREIFAKLGQDSTLNEDGSITVQTKGGWSFSVNQVEEIEPDQIAFQLAYGRQYDKEKDGPIAGRYLDGNITLSRYGDKFTLKAHEPEHMFEDMGIIRPLEIRAMNATLRGQGLTPSKESRAKWVEDNLYRRDKVRNSILRGMLQRIADFVDSLANLFKATSRSVLRGMESGKIFNRAPGASQFAKEESLSFKDAPVSGRVALTKESRPFKKALTWDEPLASEAYDRLIAQARKEFKPEADLKGIASAQSIDRFERILNVLKKSDGDGEGVYDFLVEFMAPGWNGHDAAGASRFLMRAGFDGVKFGKGIEAKYEAFDAKREQYSLASDRLTRGTLDEDEQLYDDYFGEVAERGETPGGSFSEENRKIKEEDKTLWDRAGKMLRRQFRPGGLLPRSVFEEKVTRDEEFNVVEFDTRHLIGSLESHIKKEYKAPFEKLPKATQKKLAEALTGAIAVDIKPATKATIVSMRRYVDGMSQEYAGILFNQARDLLSQGRTEAAVAKVDLLNTIIENMGEYVHRSYRAFDDKNWFKKVPNEVLSRARRYLESRYIESGETPEEAQRKSALTAEKILKTGTAYDSLEGFIKESKLGAKDLSVLKRRKKIAPEIRELLGEYEDPRINFAKTATKMGRLIWNQRFLDTVRGKGMGVFLFEGENRPLGATKQIAAEGSEVYAPLNGLWTFPEIEQSFKDALGKEQMANWYRSIVQLNGAVKFGKTILAPTTAARNWQSAFFFALANGHFDLSQMKKSLSGLREYFTQKGDQAQLDYLRKLLKLGVVYDSPYAGEMMRLLNDAANEDVLLSPDKLKLKNALKYAQKFYQFGDDFWKIIGFENEKNSFVKSGMTLPEAEKEAAERIRNTYPTYSMVGRFVQSLRRFPLAGTFVSFPSEIIRTSANMMHYAAKDFKEGRKGLALKRAAGMVIAAGWTAGLQALSMAAFGVDEEDEAVRKLSAPWNQNSNLLYTGRDEKGQLQYIDLSYLDPYNYWKRPITAILRDQPWERKLTDSLYETLEPFLGTDITAGAVFEIVANKKRETGSPIWSINDTPQKQLKDIADHLRKALQPGIASNVERTLKAIRGEYSPSGKKYDIEDEALAWVGYRVTTLDPKVSVYFKSFEFNDNKSDALKNVKSALRDPNPVGDKELKAAYQSSTRKLNSAYREMSQVVQAAKKSGLNNAEIYRVLQASGISVQDSAMLINNTKPTWAPSKEQIMDDIKKASILRDEGSRVRERYLKLVKIITEK